MEFAMYNCSWCGWLEGNGTILIVKGNPPLSCPSCDGGIHDDEPLAIVEVNVPDIKSE